MIKTMILLLSISALLSASTINCNVGSTNSVQLGNSASPDFTCEGLTFSNFQVTSADGGAAGIVIINSANYSTLNGDVSLQLNPSLSGPNQDEWLLFVVSGGVTQVELSVGGDDAVVEELACSAPISTSGPLAYQCSPGSFLGEVSDFSNDPAAPVFTSTFTATSPVYIFKDIQTGKDPQANESTLIQTFQVVPEPGTILLISIGLLGVGLYGRRKNGV